MTLTLKLLQERYVFEATPIRADLGPLHVPFDELTGTTRTEDRLTAAVTRGERVAIIGKSGSGKSSVIAHVLGPIAEGIAPMVIPVAALPSGTIDTPSHLVDHLLATVARNATTAASTVEVDLAPTTRTVTTSRKGGLSATYRWLSGEMAREVKSQTTIERHATFADKTDSLVAVLETIAASALFPVLVFDDTDRWLRNGGTKLATSFFGESLRWLLELPASLVVAVHPSYFEMSSRPHVLQYLDTQIDMPVLDSASSIEAILIRRIEQYAEMPTPDLGDVFDTKATEAILELYRESGSMRRAIQVCHTALHEAISDGANRISSRHIIVASNAS